MIRKLKNWWWKNVIKPRLEYRKFIDKCKMDQEYMRSHRLEPIKFDVYDLQDGMLPDEYWKIQPKSTGKRFNDFKWTKK